MYLKINNQNHEQVKIKINTLQTKFVFCLDDDDDDDESRLWYG